MIITDHPGPWQQYHLRPDNRNLSVMELKSKYINEQYLFETQMLNLQQQHNVFMNGGGGGPQPTTVTPPVVITDSDVLAFIAASGITDNTQKSAVNALVTSLKGYSVWTKLNAIYPFVGGTASTHKWNLKDPRDLDAAYRLSFSGGWTHNSNGITGNGTNAYADTFYFNNTTPNRTFGAYTRNTTTPINSCYIGLLENANTTDPEGTTAYYEAAIYNYGAANYGHVGYGPTTFANNTNKSGLYGISGGTDGTTNTIVTLYKNGAINASLATTTPVSSQVGRALTIGARREVDSLDGIFTPGSDTITNYTDQNIAFAFISTQFFTSAQMANLYTAVQAYQTTLGRQV